MDYSNESAGPSNCPSGAAGTKQLAVLLTSPTPAIDTEATLFPSSPSLMGRRLPRISPSGFTLIELMIVLTIISILVTIALPIANAAILRAKEAVLKSNLFTLRSLIDQYTADKLKAPQSLDDLVTAGYLRAVPKDPITGSAGTWETVTEEATILPEQTETGIYDLHSGSSAISSEGTPYNSW
jgi:general secretion pathway protein G